MKKELVLASGAAVMIMTLMYSGFFRSDGLKTYAKEDVRVSGEETEGAVKSEGKSIFGEGMGEGGTILEKPEEENGIKRRVMKTIPLDSKETAQIPRYIVEEDAIYMLDESSIVVDETERGSTEGADVVKFSRKVEDLSDNDLERIEKTMVREGINYELLQVVYEVVKVDEYGIPISYSADCEYGGLKKFGISYPIAWQLTAWYDFSGMVGDGNTVTELEEYEFISVPAKGKTNKVEGTVSGGNGEANQIREDVEPVPEPAVKKLLIKPASGDRRKERIKAEDVIPPLAVTAGAGILLPLILWFGVVTAPLYALKEKKRYRYIGRIRLKKEDGMYTAYLTRRLAARAEIPVFMIKLSRKARKKSKAGMLQIHCPDKKRILLTVGKEVKFTVEGD